MIASTKDSLPGASPEALPEVALDRIAAYFQALSEPTRLRMLRLVCMQPRTVGELAQQLGISAANASRQLAMLAERGLLRRESRGPSVIYSVAEPDVMSLCKVACETVGRQLDALQQQRDALRNEQGSRGQRRRR